MASPSTSPARASFVRSTSLNLGSILTGGSFAVAEPDGQQAALHGLAAPLLNTQEPNEPAARQPLRRQDAQEVQRRLNQAAMNTVRTWLHRLRPIVITMVVLSMVVCVTVATIFCKECYAVYNYSDLPCDQPLNTYLPGVIIVGFWSLNLKQAVVLPLMRSGVTQSLTNSWSQGVKKIVTAILCAVPGWCWIGNGVWMLNACKTCQKTNPYLFKATQEYIYAQVAVCAVMMMNLIVIACGMQLLHRLVLSTKSGGCAEAIKDLPTVQPGSPELLDEENNLKDCCICLAPMEGNKILVRTQCGHIFHQDCLMTWCKGHVDCPLCRGAIVELDEETGVPIATANSSPLSTTPNVSP